MRCSTKRRLARSDAPLIRDRPSSVPTAVLVTVPGLQRTTARRFATLRAALRPGHMRCDMERKFYVYILANRRRGVLYVGITNDLVRRLIEHKAKLVPGFTATYG